METETIKNIVISVFKDKKLQGSLISLYGRWLDEREYEDIKEYGEVIRKLVERKNVKFVKMGKRPWGPVFSVGNVNFQISVTSKALQVKQVK